MAILKMRANICPYFKNADPLVSSAQNIDILSGSPRSDDSAQLTGLAKVLQA